MKILAIDSSGLVASIAIMSDDKLIAEYTINYKKTHSQTLLPMIDEVVKMLGMELGEIDAIAIASGPGSFTGLRIGSATVKGLGLALKKPIISIPTVDGLAYNLFGTDKIICPLMDAKRNQVYTGLYGFVRGEFQVISKQKAVALDEIIEEINKLGRDVIYLGDGVITYKELITNKTLVNFDFAPSHLTNQRAGAIASLAAIYYKNGITETSNMHKPTYLRLSQAERELAEKNKSELEAK